VTGSSQRKNKNKIGIVCWCYLVRRPINKLKIKVRQEVTFFTDCAQMRGGEGARVNIQYAYKGPATRSIPPYCHILYSISRGRAAYYDTVEMHGIRQRGEVGWGGVSRGRNPMQRASATPNQQARPDASHHVMMLRERRRVYSLCLDWIQTLASIIALLFAASVNRKWISIDLAVLFNDRVNC
jgi:hypothetical protein